MKSGCELYEDLFKRDISIEFLKEPHINTEVYKEALNNQIKIKLETGNKATDELMNTIIEALNKYTIELAKEHEETLKQIALTTIHENGFDYDVQIEIGVSDFPTKYYGDIALPAGTYDALKVKVGESQGQNWWCVMFPPLCFVDVSSGIVPDSSKQELQENLNDEEYDLISKTEEKEEISFKFKLIEFFQNLKLGLK